MRKYRRVDGDRPSSSHFETGMRSDSQAPKADQPSGNDPNAKVKAARGEGKKRQRKNARNKESQPAAKKASKSKARPTQAVVASVMDNADAPKNIDAAAAADDDPAVGGPLFRPWVGLASTSTSGSDQMAAVTNRHTISPPVVYRVYPGAKNRLIAKPIAGGDVESSAKAPTKVPRKKKGKNSEKARAITPKKGQEVTPGKAEEETFVKTRKATPEKTLEEESVKPRKRASKKTTKKKPVKRQRKTPAKKPVKPTKVNENLRPVGRPRRILPADGGIVNASVDEVTSVTASSQYLAVPSFISINMPYPRVRSYPGVRTYSGAPQQQQQQLQQRTPWQLQQQQQQQQLTWQQQQIPQQQQQEIIQSKRCVETSRTFCTCRECRAITLAKRTYGPPRP